MIYHHVRAAIPACPRVRVIDEHPGYYAIQTGDTDSIHCTRRELTAWISCILSQMDTLEREPAVLE